MARTKSVHTASGGATGSFFFFSWIGALVYFVQQADGFWEGVLGILKSFVWPAFLAYEALKAFNVQ